MIVFALAETLKSALIDRNVQVDSVADGDSLLSRLTSEPADYLVMDLHMPGRLNSVPLLQAVLDMQPEMKVTIYTGAHLPCLVRSCLELGARAFVSKIEHPGYQLTSGEREILIALARGRKPAGHRHRQQPLLQDGHHPQVQRVPKTQAAVQGRGRSLSRAERIRVLAEMTSGGEGT